jgi:hypothetical protein
MRILSRVPSLKVLAAKLRGIFQRQRFSIIARSLIPPRREMRSLYIFIAPEEEKKWI